MLNATTKNGNTKRLTPARLKITVKNSVDKPKMTARVPRIDSLSFQRLIFTIPQKWFHEDRCLYSLLSPYVHFSLLFAFAEDHFVLVFAYVFKARLYELPCLFYVFAPPSDIRRSQS
jgi:hypothetical protein